MAINLLGYLAPQSATALTSSAPKAQTSTPAVQSYYQVGGSNVPAGSTGKTVTPLGVNATSPYSNQSAPSTTLPASQVAKTTPTTTSTSTQNNVSANTGAMGAVAGSASNPYVQNTQGQWVLKSSLPSGSTDAITSNTGQALTPEQYGALNGTGAASTATTQPTTAPQADSATSPTGILASLVDKANNPNPLLQQDIAKQQELAQEYGPAIATVTNTPGLLANQNARAANLTNAYGAEMQGLGTNIGALTALQGTQQSGLSQAGGLATQQVQAPYNTPLYNPTTGQVFNSATQGAGGGALNTALAQTMQLINNGTPQDEAIALSGLGNFGYAGQAALSSALLNNSGGTYNPAQQIAGANQNVTQAAGSQATAFALDTALKQLSTEQPLITNFLNQTGLNSQTNPSFNRALNTYYGNFLSPGNKALMDGYFADIKKYTSQILAANTGTIPTDVANTLASFDPSSLPVDQLVPFLDGLQQLGNNQLSVSQSQQQSSGGSPSAYTGAPVAPVTTPVVAPVQNNPGVPGKNNPVIQALIGGSINALGGIENAISGLYHSIF